LSNLNFKPYPAQKLRPPAQTKSPPVDDFPATVLYKRPVALAETVSVAAEEPRSTLLPPACFFGHFLFSDRILLNDRKKLSQFGHNVWKSGIMNAVTASLDATVGLMTKMFQWPKCLSEKKNSRQKYRANVELIRQRHTSKRMCYTHLLITSLAIWSDVSQTKQ